MNAFASLTSEQMAQLTLLFTAVAALAAGVAALGALAQVRRSRDAYAAQIYLSFSERYNSEEMAQALRALIDWRRTNPNNFSKQFNLDYEAGEAHAQKLNQARRLVSRYFDDVARLYDLGLIGRRVAIGLLSTYGIQVYYSICEPMNESRHPHRDARHIHHIKTLVPKFGEDRLDS